MKMLLNKLLYHSASTKKALYLAHELPTAGYLKMNKTLKRTCNCF